MCVCLNAQLPSPCLVPKIRRPKTPLPSPPTAPSWHDTSLRRWRPPPSASCPQGPALRARRAHCAPRRPRCAARSFRKGPEGMGWIENPLDEKILIDFEHDFMTFIVFSKFSIHNFTTRTCLWMFIYETEMSLLGWAMALDQLVGVTPTKCTMRYWPLTTQPTNYTGHKIL